MKHDEAVLVVDDDEACRQTLRTLPEFDGHRTLTASSADEAMSLIAEHQPICVILDLAQRIRSEHGSDVVLIVLTGSVKPIDQDEAERADVDYVLHKPLDVERRRGLLQRAS